MYMSIYLALLENFISSFDFALRHSTLSFHLKGFLLLFLKEFFLGCVNFFIYERQFSWIHYSLLKIIFYFSNLNISSHSLQSTMILQRNPLITLYKLPLCDELFFSSCLRFSLCFNFYSLIIV